MFPDTERHPADVCAQEAVILKTAIKARMEGSTEGEKAGSAEQRGKNEYDMSTVQNKQH